MLGIKVRAIVARAKLSSTLEEIHKKTGRLRSDILMEQARLAIEGIIDLMPPRRQNKGVGAVRRDLNKSFIILRKETFNVAGVQEKQQQLKELRSTRRALAGSLKTSMGRAYTKHQGYRSISQKIKSTNRHVMVRLQRVVQQQDYQATRAILSNLGEWAKWAQNLLPFSGPYMHEQKRDNRGRVRRGSIRHATLDWKKANEWTTNKVGAVGYSASGFNAALKALRGKAANWISRFGTKGGTVNLSKAFDLHNPEIQVTNHCNVVPDLDRTINTVLETRAKSAIKAAEYRAAKEL